MRLPLFPQFFLVLLTCHFTHMSAGGADTAPPAKEKRRLVLCNDGGSLGAPGMEAPIGIEGLVREAIDPLRDTMVDTLYWQIGVDPWMGTDTHRLSDWYLHRTKVGTLWGSDRDKFKTASEWRIYENAHQMMEQGTDPVAVVIEHGHKAGLDVFVSFRINDGHDSRLKDGSKDTNLVPMRRDHPEWLIHGDGFAKFEYNFAVPEVRAYTLALITEAIENYDLDGFDLDFCRQPKLFKNGEGEKNIALITDMVRAVRASLDARGKVLGRKLLLSMRVPPELDKMHDEGMDVASWIKDKLVDIVIVGDPFGWNYRLPVEKFKELAKGTGCKILAQNLCAFKEDRGRSASVLFGERDYYSTAQFRAVAALHWQAGADGMYLWNQHWLKHYRDAQFDRQSWKEIGDPAVLAHKDKHYIVGPQERGGPLPLILAQAGDNLELNVEIADAPTASGAQATLRLMIEQLTTLDHLDIRLNGTALDLASAKKRLNYNDCWLDLDVTKLMRKGGNALVIKCTARNPHVLAPLKVRRVDVLVNGLGK
ncbi:MAG: family 10 glycosylhydrolase [Prosthecobacter sp.]|uniref:family 10 glycosylhydrolase n=1 Tax=Prosthecobacter sp. TaxID=1965333 RepID=UPI003BAFA553